MEDKKCCLCDNDIKGIFQDMFVDHTKHSKLLLYEVLFKILKRDLIKKEENLICYSCINRINKYEFGILLAEQMEREILDSIAQAEAKYAFMGLNDFEEKKEIDLELKEDNQETSLDYIELVQDWGGEDDDDDTQKCYQEQHFEIYEMEDSQNDSSTKENNDEEYNNNNNNNNINNNGNENENNDDFVIETVPIDIKPFKVSNKTRHKRLYCEKCDILFSSLAECKEHKELHHSGEIIPLQCHICGVECESRKKLNNHMRFHQDPIKCAVCSKEFTQKGALKRHMAIHTGEKPYQCDICGKQFIHGSSFHMHNLAHGNIREETCQICGYKLRSRSHLNRHMLIHTGEKKHECPKCGQKFAQRYNMNVHLKLHEGIKRQKPAIKHICIKCDLKFKTLKALNEHNEQFHDIEHYDNDKHLVQLENLIEDQSEMYENNSIIDAYSNENVKVELLL